jgi:hypothetical protein
VLAATGAGRGAAPAVVPMEAGSRSGFELTSLFTCPGRGRLALPRGKADENGARVVAVQFAGAWLSNDTPRATRLSDPAFQASAARLARGERRARRPFAAGGIVALGHRDEGAAIARRCGPRVLPSIRMVGVRLTASGLGARLLLVRREEGWRVLAIV